MSDSWTVLRLLTWTTDYLKSHGSDSPRLDAEVLLAHARHCERIALYTAFDEIVSDDIRAKFREFVKQRASGVPVAYLVGKREFYSLSFRVTPDVLIPRPETEFVVVAALDALKRLTNSEFRIQNSEFLIADVGTGSGCIAIAIAKHAPHCRVTAIDLSPAAFAIAKENAAAHQVADRIDFLQGDLLSPLPREPRFTVIASNPPYVSESEYAALSPSVKNHEPRQALVAGPTGAEIIERLIPQSADRLLPGGWLILELSPMIAPRVADLFANDGRFEPPILTKDLSGLTRVIKARRKLS
jgi:release factor glutamine methyltransferase